MPKRKHPVKISYDKENFVVKIIPEKFYNGKEAYTLSISKNISSKSGKTLDKSVIHKFDMLRLNYLAQVNDNFENYQPKATKKLNTKSKKNINSDEELFNEIVNVLRRSEAKVYINTNKNYSIKRNSYSMISYIIDNMPFFIHLC